MMKTKCFYASVMVVFFFLGGTRGSAAQSDTSQYSEVFFEDFESDLSQWSFPSPNLNGHLGAHMSITESESFEGSGSATFNRLIKGGSAFTDRIAVTPGMTYRLQVAFKTLAGAKRKGYIGFNLFGSNDDSSYIREKWMMGQLATNDFETVGAIKPEGIFDMAVLAPANNLTWDSDDWKLYEASFTIPAGDVNYLGLKMEGTQNTFFDNVRLQLIPEPAAALLALFGLSGLLVRRRC